jgi:hypothetical protein
MKRLLIKGGKLLLGGCILTSCTSWVNAAAELTVYDGVNPLITVVDNGPGDLIGLTGAIQIQTNVGVWNLVLSTAETKPLLGSTTAPVMDVILQANSTAAGSLRLVFSDNGFGPAAGLLTAPATGHVSAGAGVTESYDVFGDPANVIGATTVHIASIGTLPLPISASGSGPLALGAPFSLTQVEQLVASGSTTFQTEMSFQVGPVPEPGVMGLGALGLAVLALRKPQRRRA